MDGISIWQLIIIVIMIAVFILPVFMALFTKKASGGNKVIWVASSVFFAWLGYLVVYFLVIRKTAIDNSAQ
jgi:hypothetical protein